MNEKETFVLKEIARQMAGSIAERIVMRIEMDLSNINGKEKKPIERVQLDNDPFADPDHKLEWRKGDSEIERAIYESEVGNNE